MIIISPTFYKKIKSFTVCPKKQRWWCFFVNGNVFVLSRY